MTPSLKMLQSVIHMHLPSPRQKSSQILPKDSLLSLLDEEFKHGRLDVNKVLGIVRPRGADRVHCVRVGHPETQHQDGVEHKWAFLSA